MGKKQKWADLFCGAGGVSAGILKAARQLNRQIDLLAVNHWPTAINTHTLNHPEVRHLCVNVENTHPLDLFPDGRLHGLAASCECRFHSNARGGGPCNEQSRSQPWQIIRWGTDLDIDDIMMENVREFLNWGPLNRRTKRPLKSKRGKFFRAFLNALAELGYTIDYRVQTAADFGDATSRQRLILIARKRRPIIWPEPTHGPGRPFPWRAARECLDPSLKGININERHLHDLPPLCLNTMRRIKGGIKKFGGLNAIPFLIVLNGTSDGHIEASSRSLDEPMPTIVAGGKHLTLVEPFIMQTDHQSSNGACVRSLDKPFATFVTKQNVMLVEPFVVKYYGTGIAKSVNEPFDTITTKARFMLVECEGGNEVAEIGIRTRMVQPHEMALAHSFPSHYQFTGNKADKTKQIGNSVPVELAAAHALKLMR